MKILLLILCSYTLSNTILKHKKQINNKNRKLFE